MRENVWMYVRSWLLGVYPISRFPLGVLLQKMGGPRRIITRELSRRSQQNDLIGNVRQDLSIASSFK